MKTTSRQAESELFNIHNYGLDIKNREIYLHSSNDESEETGIDYRVAITLEKNLRYLDLLSNEPILIHMHLPGGIWEDCLGMFDTIKTCRSFIAILAYAKVQSASSLLLQAADYRVMMPNTHMLIHYGSISIDDEHRAVMSSIQWSEQECQKMIEIFTDKCSHSSMAKDKNWKRMMVRKHIVSQLDNKSDWILTAEEAIQYGFADGVLGSRELPHINTIKNIFKKKPIKICT